MMEGWKATRVARAVAVAVEAVAAAAAAAVVASGFVVFNG